MIKNKKIFFIVLSLLLGISLSAQTFAPVDEQSEVKFSIHNFGINTNGSFKGLAGTIVFDNSNSEKSSFNVSVKAPTVNTGINLRGSHLKKEAYFDIDKFPLINFVSTKVGSSGKESIFIIKGILTIKGIAKNISFPFSATQYEKGYIFKGSFEINRLDFKAAGNSISLSDKLIINLSVYAENTSLKK